MTARTGRMRPEAETVARPGIPGLRSRAIGILLATAVAAGCGPEEDATVRSGNRVPGDGEDTVVVLYDFDERVFGPYWGMEARYLVFLPMVSREGDQYGELQPRLARRWEHSEDYREWTFHLREDLRWHDGEPVTAHDVVFTVELRSHPEVLAVSGVEAEALDDHTVRLTYDEPSNGLDWWPVYYPKHLLEDKDPARYHEWDFWTEPVGNGPYRYVRHVPKTMTELEANPDYPWGEPEIDRVVLRYASASNWPAELRAGNADAVSYVDPLRAFTMKGNPEFRVYTWWGSWMEAIHWNHRSPLFTKVDVRRALTHAIDRRGLARLLDYPPEVPLHEGLCVGRPRTEARCGELLPHDTGLAGRMLERAGWRDSDGDGIREWRGEPASDRGLRPGREFRFTILVSGDLQRREAIYVQDQLRAVGVRAEIEILDGSVLRDRLRTGRFDAVIQRFSDAKDYGVSHVGRIVGEDSPIGWRHSRAEELAAREPVTWDRAEREALYDELGRIFREEHPITFLVPELQVHVAHRRIRGLESPQRAEPVWFMEYLWVDGGSDG